MHNAVICNFQLAARNCERLENFCLDLRGLSWSHCRHGAAVARATHVPDVENNLKCANSPDNNLERLAKIVRAIDGLPNLTSFIKGARRNRHPALPRAFSLLTDNIIIFG